MGASSGRVGSPAGVVEGTGVATGEATSKGTFATSSPANRSASLGPALDASVGRTGSQGRRGHVVGTVVATTTLATSLVAAPALRLGTRRVAHLRPAVTSALTTSTPVRAMVTLASLGTGRHGSSIITCFATFITTRKGLA